MLMVVLGLGKTGISCIRYLLSCGLPVAAMDSRENPPGLAEIQRDFPQIPLVLGSFDTQLLQQAAELIVSPGISLQEPAITEAAARGVPISGDIEWFARAAKAPIVGITGTNAKGTVTTLLGLMYQCAGRQALLGGNIGTPALDLLVEPVPDAYLLELSSFQLETTHTLQLEAAAILNISPDHLDRYTSMNAYTAAKQRIYQHTKTAVYPRNEPLTKPQRAITQHFTFGLDKPNTENEFGLLNIENKVWLAQGEDALLPVDALRIKGQHNWLNALAALALGCSMGLPRAAMLTALQEFSGLLHRCQWLGEAHGISWFNDSKATNVGAALAALHGLGKAITGKLILIAGGVGKGADFQALQKPVAEYARAALVFGQDASLLKEVLAPVVPVQQVNTLADAVAQASRLAQAGDAVLLAPACASLDMFTDYNHRGEVFTALVQEILCQPAN